MIDDILQGPPESLSEQRELGFNLMKNQMAQAYAAKLKSRGRRTSLLLRQSMLNAYQEALKDAFQVFSKIAEESADVSEVIG